jgi:MarR family transcriptional regulator for hemolysin
MNVHKSPMHFGRNVNILGRLLTKRLQEKIGGSGITSSQWPMISRLYEEGVLTQTEIGEQLSIEAPTVSKTIGNLEAAGWVLREASSGDMREKNVRLSEKAEASIGRWQRAVCEMEAETLEGISAQDLRAFRRVIDRMIANQKSC